MVGKWQSGAGAANSSIEVDRDNAPPTIRSFSYDPCIMTGECHYNDHFGRVYSPGYGVYPRLCHRTTWKHYSHGRKDNSHGRAP